MINEPLSNASGSVSRPEDTSTGLKIAPNPPRSSAEGISTNNPNPVFKMGEHPIDRANGSGLRVLVGDCRETLKTIPDQSVHCVVTSPPYWTLRDYGVAGQIGLEHSLALYIEQMVAVFAEIHRVLRDDGTVWLNLGDTFFGDSPVRKSSAEAFSAKWNPTDSRGNGGQRRSAARQGSLKPKDLVGLPWRVAFALQDWGWYLRSDIIWHKRNPMPESVRDRPTKAHEYIFLLTKSQHYFYDAEAIKEPVTGTAQPRGSGVNAKAKMAGRNSRAFIDRDVKKASRAIKQNPSFSAAISGLVSSRNKRSVWSLVNAPFKGAHFATFPPELIRPCIQAGTSAHGCCALCGAPYARVMSKGEPDREHQRACGGDVNGQYHGRATKDYNGAGAQDASATKARILAGMVKRETVGWQPTCDHALMQVKPCTVLDPFGGSGTTGMVSLQEGRSAILCELNADYVKLIEQRCAPSRSSSASRDTAHA